MLITPFRVRLADESHPSGFKPGYIGTVVGEDIVPTKAGPKKVYSVLWFNIDEETGEESVSTQPAPTAHIPEELRAAVEEDYFDDEEIENLDEVPEHNTPLELDANRTSENTN